MADKYEVWLYVGHGKKSLPLKVFTSPSRFAAEFFVEDYYTTNAATVSGDHAVTISLYRNGVFLDSKSIKDRVGPNETAVTGYEVIFVVGRDKSHLAFCQDQAEAIQRAEKAANRLVNENPTTVFRIYVQEQGTGLTIRKIFYDGRGTRIGSGGMG